MTQTVLSLLCFSLSAAELSHIAAGAQESASSWKPSEVRCVFLTTNMTLTKESAPSRLIVVMWRNTHSTEDFFWRFCTYIKFPDHRIEVHLGNFEMRRDPADLDFALKTTSLKSPENVQSQRERQRPVSALKQSVIRIPSWVYCCHWANFTAYFRHRHSALSSGEDFFFCA